MGFPSIQHPNVTLLAECRWLWLLSSLALFCHSQGITLPWSAQKAIVFYFLVFMPLCGTFLFMCTGSARLPNFAPFTGILCQALCSLAAMGSGFSGCTFCLAISGVHDLLYLESFLSYPGPVIGRVVCFEHAWVLSFNQAFLESHKGLPKITSIECHETPHCFKIIQLLILFVIIKW